MFFQKAIGLAASAAAVSACAPDLYKRDGAHPKHIMKREHLPNPVVDNRGWAFDSSEEWNTLNPEWGICINGTQQSPIDLSINWGLASTHIPKFNYPDSVRGSLNNWDFGPQFAFDSSDPTARVPTLEFEEAGKTERVNFHSWHTHAPAEHTIDGHRPRAEIHFVHYDTAGNPRAVVGIFIDRAPDAPGSPFFQQLPPSPDIFNNITIPDVTLNLNLAIQEALDYQNFWTYKGSLTTPPCREGLRWYVSKDILYVNDAQLQELLGASTFSARPVQPVWLHNVNGRDHSPVAKDDGDALLSIRLGEKA